MAKTTAPLLSFDASGSLAKSLVYSKWRGISYVRRHVVPSNPQSAAQVAVRDVFSWLNNVWRYMPAEVQAPWDAYASGQPLTGRNAFLKQNVSDLIGETTLANFIMATSAKSGPIAASIATTPGAGQITVDIGAPSLPDGWTIVEGVAAAIRDQNPSSGTLFTMTAGTDATSTYQVVLTGLTASQLYYVGAWFKYLKPDGSNAYGPSLMDTDTPS